MFAFQSLPTLFRTDEALRLGVAPRVLYAWRDAGLLVQLSRGLFQRADQPPLSQPDLVTVALRIPHGVVCLISALAFHDLTTQIPHAVYLALPNTAEKPRLDYPPLRLFWLTDKPFRAGIETHLVDGVRVRMYSLEKTVVDCFRFRHKIGLEVAIEALKHYSTRPDFQPERLTRLARLGRVERIMQPYLAMLT